MQTPYTELEALEKRIALLEEAMVNMTDCMALATSALAQLTGVELTPPMLALVERVEKKVEKDLEK